MSDTPVSSEHEAPPPPPAAKKKLPGMGVPAPKALMEIP